MLENRRPGALAILLARFGFFLMEIGITKSLGVLVPDLEEQLQASNAVIGLVTSLSLAAMYLGSPLSKFAIQRCPHRYRRVVTSVSGLVAGVALIGTAFTDSAAWMSVLFFTMGLCCSVVNLQAIVLLFDYFQEDFPLASCISVLGIPIGAAILPQVTKILLDAYGVSGSLLLIGAMTLNMFPIGLVLKERPPQKQDDCATAIKTPGDDRPNGGDMAGTQHSQSTSEIKMSSNHEIRHCDGDSSNEVSSNRDTVVIGVGKEQELGKRSSVTQLLSSQEDSPGEKPEKDKTYKRVVECQVETPRINGIETSTTRKEENHTTALSNDMENNSANLGPYRPHAFNEVSYENVIIGLGTEQGPKRASVVQLLPSETDQKIVKHEIPLENQHSPFEDLEPSLSFSPEEVMVQHDHGASFVNEEGDNRSDVGTAIAFGSNVSSSNDGAQSRSSRQHPVKTCLSRGHLWVLVEEPLFSVVYLPSVLMLFTVTGGWAVFVVLYGVEHGIDLSHSAYLPTCGAVGGIIASILMSAAIWLRPRWSPRLYLLGLTISASSFFLQTLNSSYMYLLAMSFCIGFGLFGCNVIVEAVMTFTVLPRNFNDAGSLFLCTIGLGYLISGYLAGLVRDATDDIEITFMFLGAMLFIAVVLVIILLLCLWTKPRPHHARHHSDPKTAGNHGDMEMDVSHANERCNEGFEPEE